MPNDDELGLAFDRCVMLSQQHTKLAVWHGIYGNSKQAAYNYEKADEYTEKAKQLLDACEAA
jgi:hypothetical protein